jgi:hypothetical protein
MIPFRLVRRWDNIANKHCPNRDDFDALGQALARSGEWYMCMINHVVEVVRMLDSGEVVGGSEALSDLLLNQVK